LVNETTYQAELDVTSKFKFKSFCKELLLRKLTSNRFIPMGGFVFGHQGHGNRLHNPEELLFILWISGFTLVGTRDPQPFSNIRASTKTG